MRRRGAQACHAPVLQRSLSPARRMCGEWPLAGRLPGAWVSAGERGLLPAAFLSALVASHRCSASRDARPAQAVHLCRAPCETQQPSPMRSGEMRELWTLHCAGVAASGVSALQCGVFETPWDLPVLQPRWQLKPPLRPASPPRQGVDPTAHCALSSRTAAGSGAWLGLCAAGDEHPLRRANWHRLHRQQVHSAVRWGH